MDAIQQGKKTLRTICIRARKQMGNGEKTAADTAIIRAIASHSSFQTADLLLLFYPVRGEIDLLPLWEIARALGIPVAFPRCEGEKMTFHLVKEPSELVLDRFSIPAPNADAPIAKTSAKTLCILPGLAAGKDGSRLGYGGGFYDRFLATFEGISLFPVYEKQVFPKLPTEKTDRPVDLIITEKGEI